VSRCDRPLIGIDIGGVLIDDAAGDDEVFFSSGYLAAPEVPGAIDACAELGEWATCFLVSKAGTAKEGRSRSWLFSRQFPRRSGIPPTRWYFTATRSDKGRLATELGLVGFVDDRVEVLAAMPPVVRCRVVFGSRPGNLDGAVRAGDWGAALAILSSLRSGPPGVAGRMDG